MNLVRKYDIHLFAAGTLWLFVVATVPEAGYVLADWTPRDEQLWTIGNLTFLAGAAITREVYLHLLRKATAKQPLVAASGGHQ
jgi:hypothetical protein